MEDHGLIGDGGTCALVGRDGSIPWLCLPHFDDPPFLAGLLDAGRGGSFDIRPVGLVASSQRYLDDTAVLVTILEGPDGVVELTDCMPLRSGADLRELVPAGRSELLRVARVVTGTVQLEVRLRPRDAVRLTREGGAWRLLWPPRPELPLSLACSHDLAPGPDGSIEAVVDLRAGQRLTASLGWSRSARLADRTDPDQLVHRTTQAWHRWASHLRYEGPQRGLVRRSAMTLKLLDHVPSGALMAAATSSLPEEIGGVRNWDYRYTWVRDAAFSTYALRRVGMTSEADAFLAWTITNVERDGRAQLMYALDGGQPPGESEDPGLSGYRGSGPVRWGNAAAGQTQHDVYGEILDVAHGWVSSGGAVDDHLWAVLRDLADEAVSAWRTPDHGIWEIRSEGRPFTYSVAMCAVAVDRALRIAAARDLDHPRERWEAELDAIRSALLDRAWDPERRSFTEHLADDRGEGRGGLDASLLTLPLRGLLDADDERMVATTDAVRRHLDAGDGLLYRYRHDETDDGLPGAEGAFLLCSFWLVDNLTGQGRLDEAHELYASLCGRTNEVGLLSEEVDPGTGAFLGNFPQAFSHLGLIASGVSLARAEEDDAR
ncbi:glycoside hydrolase family 15 protein [Blastococcus sp. SYSU D01042]